ncbi:hypothetical protein [Caudoviricetes sp.]|nr:hypothetical protein [Caudoviricetes sp.]
MGCGREARPPSHRRLIPAANRQPAGGQCRGHEA